MSTVTNRTGAGSTPEARSNESAPSVEPAVAAQRLEARLTRERLAPYARPDTTRALFCLATSVLPYFVLTIAMWRLLELSDLWVLALAVPTSAFLVRTFIVFHDCSHGSFLRSRHANAWLGIGLGLLLYSPFLRWRHDHAVHHATSGDLDRRGVGDVRTLTVLEYKALPWRGRLAYRLVRNPLVMFGVGPIVALIIGPRIVARNARPRMRRSVIATNVALALIVGVLCWLMGWRGYLLVFGPTALLAGSIGIWLFYVQHQFEDAYWDAGENWSYADAALRGSSYLRLPPRFASARETSATTTSTTSTRASPTTTSSAPTTRTRSSTRCPPSACGTASGRCASSSGTRSAGVSSRSRPHVAGRSRRPCDSPTAAAALTGASAGMPTRASH